MSMSRTHADLAAERARMLEDVLPLLFKGDAMPPSRLIKNIATHLAIAKKPDMLQSPRAVRADHARIYDKYGPAVEVVHDGAAQHQAQCPISQSPITVPWASTCGHAFEERAVLAYVERTRASMAEARRKDPGLDNSAVTVSCPVIGCGKPLTKQREKCRLPL